MPLVYAGDAGAEVTPFEPRHEGPSDMGGTSSLDSTNCETLTVRNVTASSHLDGNLPKYAMDNNPYSIWKTIGATSPWFEVHLGLGAYICEINISWDVYIPRSVTVYVSEDRVAFKKLNINPEKYPNLENEEIFPIHNSTYTSAVRIVINNQNLSSPVGIKELNLLGAR